MILCGYGIATMTRRKGHSYSRELAAAIAAAGMSDDLDAAAKDIGVKRDTLYRWLHPETYRNQTCPEWAYNIFILRHDLPPKKRRKD